MISQHIDYSRHKDKQLYWHWFDPNGYYFCTECRNEGRFHEVKEIFVGHTDRHSCWGDGVPCYIKKCTGCGIETGKMVRSDDVGGCW